MNLNRTARKVRIRVSTAFGLILMVSGPLLPCLIGEVGVSQGKGFRRRAHKHSAEPRETAPLTARGATPLSTFPLFGSEPHPCEIRGKQ